MAGFASLQSLSIDREGEDADELQPLDVRVLSIVKSSPNRTVRPAQLAAELGISVNDASAELCGLMAAVGGGEDGATFRFEKVEGQNVMVFTFPADFEKRALRKRRQQDFWQLLQGIMHFGIKLLKIITAFGLILSLLILCIAAILGLVAAIVSMSRGQGGSGHQRSALVRQLRSLFYTTRQLLWCYALFGPDGEGQDPFLREIAYDLSLMFSVCCGNPGSIFFWLRASQLSRRRRRAFRGWGERAIETDVEGVSLVRRGSWGEDENEPSRDGSDEAYRGLLSVAVEFLFGPTSAVDEEAEKWKLRAAALLVISAKNAGEGVSLEEMSPYTDSPPISLDDTAQVIGQGLKIVAHFNGIPSSQEKEDYKIKTRFIFPELMAESTAAQYYKKQIDDDDGTWETFFYAKDGVRQMVSTRLPSCLQEKRYRFTKLSSKQLMHCILLGTLNLVGVIWFGQSVSKGGVLEVEEGSSTGVCLKMLLRLLLFYALLFFVLPSIRLLIILALNKLRLQRNDRRQFLAESLSD